MKRIAVILSSIGAIAVLAIVMYTNRRGDRTFEGRTAGQWLDHYAAHGVDPEPRVVDHFGTNAVSLVFGELENFSLSEKTSAREKVFAKARNRKARERTALAWCKLLMHQGPSAFEAVLTGADVNDVYRVFIVLENDPLKQALARAATNGTRDVHRERAAVLQQKLYGGAPTNGVSL